MVAERGNADSLRLAAVKDGIDVDPGNGEVVLGLPREESELLEGDSLLAFVSKKAIRLPARRPTGDV